MRATTRKTLRDLRRQRAQVVAVAVTIMLGVALYIASAGAFDNLSGSYDTTYHRLRFADLTATGGDPDRIAAAARTAGATASTTRTVVDPPLLVAGTRLIGRVIGLPATTRPAVDDLDVRQGAYLSRPTRTLSWSNSTRRPPLASTWVTGSVCSPATPGTQRRCGGSQCPRSTCGRRAAARTCWAIRTGSPCCSPPSRPWRAGPAPDRTRPCSPWRPMPLGVRPTAWRRRCAGPARWTSRPGRTNRPTPPSARIWPGSMNCPCCSRCCSKSLMRPSFGFHRLCTWPRRRRLGVASTRMRKSDRVIDLAHIECRCQVFHLF